MTMLKLLAAAATIAALSTTANAQEHMGHNAAPAANLPAICLANAPAPSGMGMGMGMGMGAMDMGAMGADAAHTDLMDGMGAMNSEMMAGGTASDIDVAFVCSMIPHHRGAIDMAKAELAHGDDPWAKELAQAVITAQEKEIADMIAWLDKQPQ
jgi:uncharacterized protein (DUF305 family)